jgi:hypothetical protein
VTISSKIRGTPCRAVTARTPSRKPGCGTISRWNGSMITAARSPWCSAIIASAVAASLNGAISTSPWIACGMPAESGVGAGKAFGSRGPTLISE